MSNPPSTSYRVAIVDDDEACRDLLEHILTQRGHDVSHFEDPRQALRAIQRALDARPFDVVISDLNMPQMQGDAFFANLNERLGHHAPPLVMISAADDEDTVGRALDAGARHFIRKPISHGELLAVVERAARTINRPERLRAGTRLGRYVIDRELGRGGMGIVYRAHDRQGGSDVAIKVLAQSNLEDQLRFRRELDILAGLQHPGLAALLETGRLDTHVYYAMELVRGDSLEALIERGPLPPQRVARFGAALADTLAYIHGEGVIHRDVKPENIVINPQRLPRLIDFGVARRPLDRSVTRHDWVVGTPQYLAPEVLLNNNLTPASDIFALGVTLHEAALGQHVFLQLASNDPFEFARRVERNGYPFINDRRSMFPADLDDAIAQTLQPNPLRRPSAADLARHLQTL